MARKKSKAEKKIETLTVVQLAQELGKCPKKARAKMRAAGYSASGKRYPVMERGSKEFLAVSEIIA